MMIPEILIRYLCMQGHIVYLSFKVELFLNTHVGKNVEYKIECNGVALVFNFNPLDLSAPSIAEYGECLLPTVQTILKRKSKVCRKLFDSQTDSTSTAATNSNTVIDSTVTTTTTTDMTIDTTTTTATTQTIISTTTKNLSSP